MFQDQCAFSIDAATKFHRNLYIYGWFHRPGAPLQAVRLRAKGVLHQFAQINVPHHAVEPALGPGKGFVIQALLAKPDYPEDALIEFQVRGEWVSAPLQELLREREESDPSGRMDKDFQETIRRMPGRPKLLDIGGRDRSAIDRSKQFPNADVTVLDILPGSNVDVVGDAHELSKLFEPETFDAVYSVSVFEHLLMPWKVAVEINKVLKTGGVGLVSTHQTLGMHDEPWDFYRFSAHAWDSLFNSETGFVIENRCQSMASFILPLIYRANKREAEQAAGFESSVVLFRKIGPTALDWNVPLNKVIATMYPSNAAA
ncbi:MAG: class I SAM-dependent methyltransferase [Hyphomicrobiales bacterium]|nr:class I SAM-dependent methyltransferase [Hyphomicrobiales bacterium]